MEQLYVILRNWPALSTKFDLHWDHKICFQLKHDQFNQELNQETKHDITYDAKVTPNWKPGYTYVHTMTSQLVVG
jgi:hypothetical protein